MLPRRYLVNVGRVFAIHESRSGGLPLLSQRSAIRLSLRHRPASVIRKLLLNFSLRTTAEKKREEEDRIFHAQDVLKLPSGRERGPGITRTDRETGENSANCLFFSCCANT